LKRIPGDRWLKLHVILEAPGRSLTALGFLGFLPMLVQERKKAVYLIRNFLPFYSGCGQLKVTGRKNSILILTVLLMNRKTKVSDHSKEIIPCITQKKPCCCSVPFLTVYGQYFNERVLEKSFRSPISFLSQLSESYG